MPAPATALAVSVPALRQIRLPGLPAALRTVSLTVPGVVVVQLMRAALAARFLEALTTRRLGVIRRPWRTMRTGAGVTVGSGVAVGCGVAVAAGVAAGVAVAVAVGVGVGAGAGLSVTAAVAAVVSWLTAEIQLEA